jgi:hypothetical protein
VIEGEIVHAPVYSWGLLGCQGAKCGANFTRWIFWVV